MSHLLLVNPNTNAGTTGQMVEIAKQAAPSGVAIRGATASFGVPLITDEEQLLSSAVAVERLVSSMDLAGCGGVIVAAFGDPGLGALRRRMALPVTGIAEAAFQEAASHGRRFCVVTTTPNLVPAIQRCAEAYGHGRLFAGVRVTDGDILELSNDPLELGKRLAQACEIAVSQDAAEVIIIGGGPLAVHAKALARRFSIPIVEPIPAAVRLAARRAADLVVET